MLPELDYAFLANYATVQDGKLTAVGASFTYLAVDEFPASSLLSVAGRVRADADTEPVPLRVQVTPPDATDSEGQSGPPYELSFGTDLQPGPNARPYRGKLGLLFTLTLQLPIVVAGLYQLDLYLGDVHVRRLSFEAEQKPQQNA